MEVVRSGVFLAYFETESTEFLSELEVQCEKKREAKMSSRLFFQSSCHWRDGYLLRMMDSGKKPVWWGDDYWSIVFDGLILRWLLEIYVKMWLKRVQIPEISSPKRHKFYPIEARRKAPEWKLYGLCLKMKTKNKQELHANTLRV